jgi:N-acetylglucosaminyldiphosphoundecaprenol N-acetyl-beta-D-mannosaminyltransferase
MSTTMQSAVNVARKNTVDLFGMQLDPLRMPAAVEQLLDWVDHPDGNCHYVVTPNVDHAVMFQKHVGLQRAYADASLVLADGFPVLAAAKLLCRPIPERVPGSDLVPALFETVNAEANAQVLAPAPLRVFLLGAAPGVAERAAEKIEQRWPAITVVGCYSPPLGFEKDAAENAAILQQVAAARPDVLIVGLGAPKQELWVHAHHHEIAAPVALCVGATIDFLAGEKPRAPAWMRRVGLEWLHRMLSEPRRLTKRYMRDAWVFPQLVWREWATGRGAVSVAASKNASEPEESAGLPEIVDQAGLWDLANSR